MTESLTEYAERKYDEFVKKQQRQYYLDNIETIKARDKAYYKRTFKSKRVIPLQTEEQKKESKKQSQKKWRLKNKEYTLQYLKKWQKDNPDRMREYRKRYSKNKWIFNHVCLDSVMSLREIILISVIAGGIGIILLNMI